MAGPGTDASPYTVAKIEIQIKASRKLAEPAHPDVRGSRQRPLEEWRRRPDLDRLALDPADPATLYAATLSGGVFKSTDAGETWSLAGLWPSGIQYRTNLLVDPEEPEVVYAGTHGLGVLRLDQSGS